METLLGGLPDSQTREGGQTAEHEVNLAHICPLQTSQKIDLVRDRLDPQRKGSLPPGAYGPHEVTRHARQPGTYQEKASWHVSRRARSQVTAKVREDANGVRLIEVIRYAPSRYREDGQVFRAREQRTAQRGRGPAGCRPVSDHFQHRHDPAAVETSSNTEPGLHCAHGRCYYMNDY